MTIDGFVANGTIVLADGVQLPEGTQVEVVVKTAVEKSGSSLASLLKYAGAVKDLPPDMARNHDHYLHGAPKK
jgi:hypothetical protein